MPPRRENRRHPIAVLPAADPSPEADTRPPSTTPRRPPRVPARVEGPRSARPTPGDVLEAPPLGASGIPGRGNLVVHRRRKDRDQDPVVSASRRQRMDSAVARGTDRRRIPSSWFERNAPQALVQEKWVRLVPDQNAARYPASRNALSTGVLPYHPYPWSPVAQYPAGRASKPTPSLPPPEVPSGRGIQPELDLRRDPARSTPPSARAKVFHSEESGRCHPAGQIPRGDAKTSHQFPSEVSAIAIGQV